MFTLSILLGGLATVLMLVGNPQDIREKAAAAPTLSKVACNSITISPDKKVYKPGEKVKITIKGAGPVSNIQVNWIAASSNLIYNKPWNSKKIEPFTYNSGSKTTTANWTVPRNGEYLLMVNVFGTNGDICAGNPGYTCSGCEKGTVIGKNIPGGGIKNDGKKRTHWCKGCHKTVVVNSNRTFRPSFTAFKIGKKDSIIDSFSWINIASVIIFNETPRSYFVSTYFSFFLN